MERKSLLPKALSRRERSLFLRLFAFIGLGNERDPGKHGICFSLAKEAPLLLLRIM